MLWSLFSGSSSNKERKLSPISSAAGERFLAELSIKELEAIPAHAAKAFQLAHDPTADFSDFVSVIELDEALTAKVVRLANSVYYSRGEPCESVEQAVATVGIDELRCLLAATLLNGLVGSPHPVRTMCWANSVATALLAKRLAHNYTNIDSSSAFLSGIMHDLGKLFMIKNSPDQYFKVIEKVCYEDSNVVTAEEEIYDLNHTELGQWIAEEWNFPDQAVKSIKWHHDPLPTEAPVQIWHLISMADTICHALGIGHEGTMKRLQTKAKTNLSDFSVLLGIEEDTLKAAIESFKKDHSAEAEALMHFIR